MLIGNQNTDEVGIDQPAEACITAKNLLVGSFRSVPQLTFPLQLNAGGDLLAMRNCGIEQRDAQLGHLGNWLFRRVGALATDDSARVARQPPQRLGDASDRDTNPRPTRGSAR